MMAVKLTVLTTAVSSSANKCNTKRIEMEPAPSRARALFQLFFAFISRENLILIFKLKKKKVIVSFHWIDFN